MYALGHKYQIADVTKTMIEEIIYKMEPDNLVQVAIMSDLYQEQELLEYTLNMMKEHVKDIHGDKDWRLLETNHPEILTKLILKLA